MSYTLNLLRDDLRTHLGMDADDLPNTEADRLLNRAWWYLTAKLRFSEKESEYSFTTVAGTREYSIPVEEDAIQRVIILENGTENYSPLRKIDDWNMFGNRSDDVGLHNKPYQYSRRNNDLVLNPVPDDAYTIRVKYLRTLADIQSSGPEIPQEWHEVILWGAISRGFFVRGDYSRGERAANQQALLLNTLDTPEEKEVEDKGLSGFSVLRRRYP